MDICCLIKNFFSINKRFGIKMNSSFSQAFLSAIEIQKPTKEEIDSIKRKVRYKKLKKLKKIF